MKFAAVILVASFGSAAAAKAITLEKNEFSVKDENVVVEFSNPEDAQDTNWVGIFDKNDEYVDYLYTCGSFVYTDCENESAEEEGMVVFNFKTGSVQAGTHTVCLMNELDDGDEQLGECQEIELVGKKKSPIKIKKKISMYDPAVKVKFNNPGEPRCTNWVGFYDLEDQFVEPFSYTSGSDEYKSCKSEPAKKKGKVFFNFTEADMQAGKYNACLMDDTDPTSDNNDNKQIGICQKITVYNPKCLKSDTKEECKKISCTWKKNKNKCK
mmetsp:Transcript_38618/g.43485  ORF Transcript_38618/g.43485 Transcript_38618/m.43485 type:complete len:268 (+) Transcript_38618:69-872(+)